MNLAPHDYATRTNAVVSRDPDPEIATKNCAIVARSDRRHARATHMHRRKVEEDAALADIGVALDKLENERQNPDRWERVPLTSHDATGLPGGPTIFQVEQCRR
jgi:hypothetical protein